MLTAYKLLTQDLTSHNNTKWKLGKTKRLPDKGNYTMCSKYVLHCYAHPLLAIFYNPIHANIQKPRLFKIEIDRVVATDGKKQASLEQTLLIELPLPTISTEQRVHIAILCAKTVYTDKAWNAWADSWLSGKDRTIKAAYATTNATYADADAAYAAYTAADAAYAAAIAADAAANATTYATTYAAAYATTNAATYAAADAAYAATNATTLITIIQSVLNHSK